MHSSRLLYSLSLLSISLLLMVWTIAPNVNCCWGSTSTNLGDMTPDQKLLDGSPLIIDCSLNNKTIVYEKKIYHVDSSMISFKFNNKFYPNDRIELINDRLARLKVEKSSYSDNGMYYCMLNISGLNHRPFICLSHITVGYKPQSVTNFKCISLHYRRLNCSWTPPRNPISTTYILEDVFHASYEHLSRKCGITSNNSCEWTMDSVPPFRNTALQYNLVLTGTNEFGNNSELFIVDHYSIIKPNKPKYFQSTKYNETAISLKWSPPEYIEFDEELLENIIYEIRYFSLTPNQKDESQTVILDGIRNTSIHLSDLIPNLRYNISIRCKTTQSKSDDYWSEFSSIVIQTKADVPYSSPGLIPQSFQTDKNMEGMRSITLFWKGIPSIYQNGPDFHYLIRYKEVLKRKVRAINLLEKSGDTEVESQNTTYTFNHMKSDASYEFTIFGVNSVGISLNSSRIVVERNEEIPHKPSNIDVYSFGGGRYEVQWTKPRENLVGGPIINYTVFWCQNLRPRPFLCEGAIDWMPTKNTSIALELPNIETNYQFAVSANGLAASSGMSWAECIVPIDGRLDKLSEVQLKVHNSTSIVVNWKLNCPAQKRVVEGYKIKFCAIDNSAKVECARTNSVEVDNSAENYVLNNLEPFTKYRITVLAYSDSGPSEESDSRFAVTFHDSPEDSPSSVEVTNRTAHTIELMWRPPIKPNGHISHYNIECNDKVYTQSADNCNGTNCTITIENLQSYRSYDIRVRACNSESLCSPDSKVLPVLTLKDVPHIMDPPRSEMINSTTVRISWSPPIVANGPIDYYLLKLNRNDNTTEDIYNISGKIRSYLLTLNCQQMEDSSASYRPQYSVQLSSVNVLEADQYLTAEFSESTNLNACLLAPPRNLAYIIGLIGGGAFGLIILVLVLVVLVRWMKRKINSYRNLEIELPKGLEVPVLLTNGNTEQMDGQPFDPFGRSDSFTNVCTFGDNTSINKNRHGSGLSNTSNDSTERLYNKTSNKIKDNFFRLTSDESGQQSVSSSAEAHMSSDSGVETDIQLQNIETIDMQSINKVSPLSILDEMSSRDSDSSDKDSGINARINARNKKPKRKPNNNISKSSNTKISPQVKPFETPIVTNPLYDTPMIHSVCIYSLLANSEPSLFEIPVREDDNILSDLTKFSKPEMAKSLTNIIQSYSPSDPKINCIICETNNSSSRGSTRTSSPNCPYYKYGIKRQNHNQTNYVTNISPEKKKGVKVTKTNNGYITLDSIPQNGESIPLPKSPKKRFEHGWSQNSYDAEVSSTSSNGDNEQTDLILTQNNSLTKSCLSFTDCEKIQNKIQNNCSFDDNTELITIDSPLNPLNTSLNDLVIQMEPTSDAVKEINNPIEKTIPVNSSQIKTSPVKTSPVKTSPVKTSPVKTTPTHLAKDSNGYVLHKSLNQMSVNSIKPNLIKNSNGYVVLEAVHNGCDGIEMTDYVPNNDVLNHVTQV